MLVSSSQSKLALEAGSVNITQQQLPRKMPRMCWLLAAALPPCADEERVDRRLRVVSPV